MSGDLGRRKTSTVASTEATASSSQERAKNAKETKTMAADNSQQQKPDFLKLIQFVYSSDIQACNEAAAALRELLLNGDATLLLALLSQYVLTNSEKLLEIIAAVRHPLDKVLLDQMADIWRVHPHACLSILSHLVLKQVPWLYRFPQHPSFGQFLKAIKSSTDDSTYCIGSALVLASLLLSAAPLINNQNLPEICTAFLFLAAVLKKKTPSASEDSPHIRLSLLHFRLALYAVFQRLYGLFPCHFLTFLRQNFAGPQTTEENRVLYQEVIRPMLDIVKLHPSLVTANKEGELAKERWVRKEVHDLLAECNRVAGDPYENYIAEDDTASQYFRRGLVRPLSSSNFLLWTSGQQPSSSTWASNKPTPIKDGIPRTPAVTPRPASLFQGRADDGERRQLSLVSIELPGAGSSTLQKSTSSSSQQPASYWSPSDAVGLSTPPEGEDAEQGRLRFRELRLKSEGSKTTRQAVGRKTSMAAGPESPAPHTRSFRTGSWGADARQKFVQNQQQEHSKQPQSSSELLEPEQKSVARRSFGQAFAKLFQRPAAGGGSSSMSLPQSPAARRTPGDSSFCFDFEPPTEYRATTMVNQYRRESNLSQQAELAEEADETAGVSSTLAVGSGGAAGSLAGSKRPSLSEPVLFEAPPSPNRGAPEEEISEPMDLSANGVTWRKLSAALKTLTKENDENLLEDPELQRYWNSGRRQYNAQIQKHASFSSSRTSSSAAVTASGDRTRHSSSATAAAIHNGLSRHSSLLDTQAVAGNNGRSASMTPPIGIPSNETVTFGDGQVATGFTLGAPEDDEDDELTKLKSSTGAADNADSAPRDGSMPRLSTSQSVADYISRVNRLRFDSRCLVGEESVNVSEQHLVPSLEKPTPPEVVAALPAEFRRRGSTFSGVIPPRPISCPPNASAAFAATQAARRKQGNLMDQSTLSDEAAEKQEDDEEQRPYDALLLLTQRQTIAPPSITIGPTPYELLDEYMNAARALHSGNGGSWPSEAKDATSAGGTYDGQSADLQSGKKMSAAQRKAAAMQQHQGHSSGQKDATALLKSEIQDLQMELALWKQRVFFERHQRLLHAERNRRLYGRLKQATTLDEQNQAQRDQLRLQEDEIRQLLTALTELRRQNASQRQEFAVKEFQLTSRLQTFQRENETLKCSLMASKRTADELLVENSRLRKDLGGFVQKLFDKEAAYAQLQEHCQDAAITKHNVAQLNKELFLMGEMNRRLRERVKSMKLRQEEFDTLRERLRSSEETAKEESGACRRMARKDRHKADAATQRVQELEALVQKRQAQIAESKRRLDQASDIHQEQLAACRMKYAALMTACQRQEAHILELYDKLEAKGRRKSGVHFLEGGIFPGVHNGDEHCEDAADGPSGVDIPDRAGVASEIRSYDSYHSSGYTPQHQVAAQNSVASLGSCQSELFLPYLFNLESRRQNQARHSEDEQDGEEEELPKVIE